jgi:hypothetical protein
VKPYIPHIILLGVFLAALIPTLYYYQRRNPNPRFRPGFGEMLLLFVFALAIGGPACYMVGDLFRKGVNTKDFEKPPDEGAGWSNNTSIPQEDEDEKDRKRKNKDD